MTNSHRSKAVNDYVKCWKDNPDNTCTFCINFFDLCLTSVYQPPDAMYNKPFKVLVWIKYIESISTELTNGNLNIGDKCKVSRDDLINFLCQTIDELNEKYHQSKQIFKSFEQCGLNHLYKNTDLSKSLRETSMYKALTDQYEGVTLNNEQNIFSNDKPEDVTVSNEQNIFTNSISDCESDESNI